MTFRGQAGEASLIPVTQPQFGDRRASTKCNWCGLKHRPGESRDGVVAGDEGAAPLPPEIVEGEVVEQRLGAVPEHGARHHDQVRLARRHGRAKVLAAELDNDANVAGLAEHIFGAARDASSSIFVTVSTGIGAGLILHDRIWRGANGIAGEIGHFRPALDGPVCGFGGPGCLEALAAGPAIARDASAAYGQELGTREVFERAARGESRALDVVTRAARIVGVSLASLQKVIDPEVWVLGGGVSQQERLFIEPLRAAAEEAMEGIAPIRIRTAVLGSDAGVVGAAALWHGRAS